MLETPLDSPPAPRTADGPARTVALLVVCIGMVMVSIDTSAVNVALPTLRRDFGGGLAGLQWVVDSYTLIFAALLLMSGAAGDRMGPRRVFRAGLLLFSAASAACGFAPAVWVLAAARGIQGVGAALLLATCLPLLQGIYHTAAERARAFGIWGGAGGVAVAVGPVVGGALVSTLGWRAVFFINVPFGLLGYAVTARCLPDLPGRPRHLDLPAQVLSLAALGSITYAVIQAGTVGWTSSTVIGFFALGLAGALAFAAVERRAEFPMLDLGFFSDTGFSAATLCALLNNVGFFGQLFVVGYYFQTGLHYSAVRTGFAVLPQAAAAAAGAFLCGRVTARTGARLPMLIGLASGAAGLAGLGAVGLHAPYTVLLLPMTAVGFAVGFTAPAAMTVVMSRVAPQRAGIASGVINTARQTGSVLGVAVLGSLLGTAAGNGGRVALLTGAGAYAVATVLALVFLKDQPA